MKLKHRLIPCICAALIATPAIAQPPMNPWEPNYQNPYMADQRQVPKSMTPEQMEEMRRQRQETMMQRRAMMMQDKQSRMKGGAMDCQHDGMGKKGRHGQMKHGQKQGNKHGKGHQQHRQQMEQRLERIESLLKQLVDQQNKSQ